MSFDKLVEEKIREAQQRGEFDNLPGKGKPIDLTAYFETPEDIRLAQSVLKNGGFTSREVDLLNEIAALKEILVKGVGDSQKQEILKQIQEKQIEFSVMMEWMKRLRK
jgi:hypothetical protein